MAFRLTVKDYPVEFRKLQSGVSANSGKAWQQLICEDEDGNQISVSVPAELMNPVTNSNLRKGEYLVINIVAIARADGNSYLMLTQLPTRYSIDGDDY